MKNPHLEIKHLPWHHCI